MAIIVNDPYAQSGGGGQEFGKSIGSVLENLTHHKMRQIQERHESSQAFKKFSAAGYTPQEISKFLLVKDDPKSLASMMQYADDVRRQKEATSGDKNPLEGMLSSLNTSQPSQVSSPMENLSTQKPQQGNPDFNQIMQSLTKPVNPMDSVVAQNLYGKQEKPQPVSGLSGENKQQSPVSKPVVEKDTSGIVIPQEVFNQIEPSPLLAAQEEAKKIRLQPGLTPIQRVKESNKLLKDAKEEQYKIDTSVKPYIDELENKGKKGFDESSMIFSRMKKLIASGNLTGSTMYNLRNKLEHSGHLIGGGIGTALGAIGGALAGTFALPGVGTVGGATLGATVGAGSGTALGAALTPKFVGTKEDQEFTKLSRRFMDQMKAVFGSRVTQNEVALYMDSIPSLALTDEGKLAVINDMEIVADAWRYQNKVKDKIVTANKGKVPANIRQLVEVASKPYLDKLAKRFTEGSALSINV